MTPEQFQKKLDNGADELIVLIENAPVVQVQVVLGNYLARIFNDGQNTAGGNIGQYVGGPYKAKRNKTGKRIDKVDLQFTGGLFESINIGTQGVDTVIGFTNVDKAQLSKNLEDRYGQVFTVSENELKEAEKLMIDYINEGVAEIIKKW